MTQPPISPGAPLSDPQPPTPAGKRGLSQGTIGGIVVGVLLAATVGYYALGGTWPPKFLTGDATGDVTITICGMSSDRTAKADLRVHNGTSAAHDYVITVTFHEGDEQVGSATSIIEDLAPGGYASDSAVAFVDAHFVTCKVTKAQRT